MPGATVIVVPDDPDTWNTGSPVRPDRRGRAVRLGHRRRARSVASGQGTAGEAGFVLTQLPAGRYLVIGVADSPVGPRRPRDDRAVARTGRRRERRAGQTATVKIKVTK